MSNVSQEDLKKNVKDKDIWLRLVYLIVFGFIIYFCSIIAIAAGLFQFFAKLFTSSPSKNLVDAGNDLATYMGQVVRYVTFASEEKPFPFAPLSNSKNPPPAGL